jgi:hypothetical protein
MAASGPRKRPAVVVRPARLARFTVVELHELASMIWPQESPEKR